MAIRFSFLQGYNSGLNQILRLQEQTYNTQNQVSTGRRVVTPSDDPVASARIIQVNQELSQVNQYIDNADAVENRLSLAENQIQQGSNLLVRIRELSIQASGPALTINERTSIAEELDGRLDELFDLANTRDINGEYIFAGYQGAVQPFIKTDSGQFVYQGDQGQRLVQIASTTQVAISDSGKDIFVDIEAAANGLYTKLNPNNTGNAVVSGFDIVDQAAYDANYPTDYIINFTSATTYEVVQEDGTVVLADPQPYTPGTTISFNGAEIDVSGSPAGGDSILVNSTSKQDILTTVANLSAGLKSLGDTQAERDQLTDLINETLYNLDRAEDNFSMVTSQIGARQNTLDSVRDMQSGVVLVNEQVLSELRDLDYAEALSRLTLETFTLEAAQQSFARVSNLSLFNFL